MVELVSGLGLIPRVLSRNPAVRPMESPGRRRLWTSSSGRVRASSGKSWSLVRNRPPESLMDKTSIPQAEENPPSTTS